MNAGAMAGLANLPTLSRLADGRPLPRLLFVTCAAGLALNIGKNEAHDVLNWLKTSGALVHDSLPLAVPVADATSTVQALLKSDAGIAGVVLIGGYDIVPSVRLDVLEPALRRRVPDANSEGDAYVVWSDDAYGDRSGTSFADVPVSRIPDGLSASLVYNALQCRASNTVPASIGVRNKERPFADAIFNVLPGVAGSAAMMTTSATTPAHLPVPMLGADHVYLMLHGSFADTSRYWGEDGYGRQPESLNVGNVPNACGAIIFTGCCWGALTVTSRAKDAMAGQPVAQLTVASSIALSYLAAGARAFVGCTGSHYSPAVAPYGYKGGPLHEAFWQRIVRGEPPAEALFHAKYTDYMPGIPHVSSNDLNRAVERKILRQFTCLGLGW